MPRPEEDFQSGTPPESPRWFATTHWSVVLGAADRAAPGATQALRYVAVPGKYEGCIPYKKGDRAWAT